MHIRFLDCSIDRKNIFSVYYIVIIQSTNVSYSFLFILPKCF